MESDTRAPCPYKPPPPLVVVVVVVVPVLLVMLPLLRVGVEAAIWRTQRQQPR